MKDLEYVWVENCKLIAFPDPPVRNQHRFQAPNGKFFEVYEDTFELEQ